MSESPYPSLIERFRGQRSMTIVCERCHEEAVLDPDELLNDGTYECPADRRPSLRPRRRRYRCPVCFQEALLNEDDLAYHEGEHKRCGAAWEPIARMKGRR